VTDRNAPIIEEFRANGGVVGGSFEGRELVLVHHRGRRTGAERVSPLACLVDAEDPDTVYVFASRGGAPAHPGWYFNLAAAGTTEIERGAERYAVTVRDLHGEERDRVYAEQVRRFPVFGQFEESTRGIRTIPVLALTRA